MRVLHISDCYLPRLGGIETQVRQLARTQADAGDEVAVLTATPGEQIRRGREWDGPVLVIRATERMPVELPVSLRARKDLRETLAHWQPDVVHVHVGLVSPFAFPLAQLAAAAGVPTVVTVHSMWTHAHAGIKASATLLRMRHWPVLWTAVSQPAADEVSQALGVPVQILPNAVDTDFWQPLPHPVPATHHGPLRLVATMRLAPRKRTMPLLRLVAQAQKQTSLTLTIAGDGPARERAQQWIERKNLAQHIFLPGRLAANELLGLYRSADVFVAPAVLESFGLAALEARAAGLPVLGFAAAGIRTFITDNTDGLLVDRDADLQEAIVRLGQNRRDLARLQSGAQVPVPYGKGQVLTLVRELYTQAQQSRPDLPTTS